MESSSYFSIKDLVQKVKEEVFSDIDPYALIASSAYDTAWLAMVPDTCDPSQPMFKNCLDWVLKNQKQDGFWGDCDSCGMPTIECLPSTIACLVALKRWNLEETMIDKGTAFIQSNADKLIEDVYETCPRWFAIIFPAMLELARTNGLKIIIPDKLKGRVMDTFYRRQEILEREKLVDKDHYPPLLAYLEALPLYSIDQEDVIKHLDTDGSLFQSPSATARAFMATGNKHCLNYLQSLVQRFPNGVPSTYPMDEDLIKLCMINQLHRLGLAEHFNREIEQVLEHVYRNYMNQEPHAKPTNLVAPNLYKDSLAFWLLRMYGYNVSPRMFCWFLLDEDIKDHIRNNHELFSSVMLNVHKATDLMFSGEYEVEEAKSFSRKLLEKSIPMDTNDHNKVNYPFPNFHAVIKNELKFPWLARLDHLENRMWIEEKNVTALWMGKASFLRLSSLYNDKLMQLATQNFEYRQSIYMKELEELKRWSKDWGLTDMGFGREKTTYCYFAVAASTSLPQDSHVRMIVAKSAILITVADDFYDMEGSLYDLEKLTDAIQRWDAIGLNGPGKTIFNVLDDLVKEMAATHFQREGTDITNSLQYIWHETFSAWFMEAKWSRSGFRPTEEEYLKTGMTSIATHTLVLPASCFLSPSLPKHKLKPEKYENVTKLLMIIPRLLNDMQSYEKEQKEGKQNFVLLHMEKNMKAEIEDSITYVKEMVDEKKREFIEHVLMDGFNDLSKESRHLHLSCLKVFQMFFDSSNRYDSSTDMLQDIQKAIYLPVEADATKPLKLFPQELRPFLPPSPLHSAQSGKRHRQIVVNYQFGHRFKNYTINYSAKPVAFPGSRNQSIKAPVALNSKLSIPLTNFASQCIM